MSPAHVLEPTYEALKHRLICGHWPGGLRLEATKIADGLGVSMTPVRDSLYRLTGENFVDFVHGEGFRVPVLSESKLRDLFELHTILINVPLASRRKADLCNTVALSDVTERTVQIFRNIARRSSNRELNANIAAVSDKLHLARSVEAEIFPELESELAELEAALNGSRTADVLLRGLVARYHDRRIGMAADYISALRAKRMME